MNAPNPFSEDRLGAEIRQAQRAHEPSMEEILASIRSIIADEPRPSTKTMPRPAPAASAAQIVHTSSVLPVPRSETPRIEPIRAEVRRLETPILLPQQAPTDSSPPRVVWRKPPAPEDVAPQSELSRVEAVAAPRQPEFARRPEARPYSPEVDETLASETTEVSVAASFGALQESLARRSSELAEDMTRELLRPMLKTWLDENLPTLVERLVRAEIQRVARGAR